MNGQIENDDCPFRLQHRHRLPERHTPSRSRTSSIHAGLHQPDYLGGSASQSPPGLEEATRQAIDANFKCIELSEAVLQESLNLRRTHRLKLPDAMI